MRYNEVRYFYTGKVIGQNGDNRIDGGGILYFALVD